MFSFIYIQQAACTVRHIRQDGRGKQVCTCIILLTNSASNRPVKQMDLEGPLPKENPLQSSRQARMYHTRT